MFGSSVGGVVYNVDSFGEGTLSVDTTQDFEYEGLVFSLSHVLLLYSIPSVYGNGHQQVSVSIQE